MKLMHSADWHLDAPAGGSEFLRKRLLEIPEKVAGAARDNGCDLLLLSGDLFDGPYRRETYLRVYEALASLEIPVFISPGNHDPLTPDSVWLAEPWPENVHIFRSSRPESIAVPELDCRVFGAAFLGPESAALLAGFQAEAGERYCVGVFHGDPMVLSSPYNPVTALQIEHSRLDYLALGHIHKSGQLRRGGTLCGWPGCPMGRGFDETGEKGVLLVHLDQRCRGEFLPLDTPRFYRQELDAQGDPAAALRGFLPAAPSEDFYRITLAGEAPPFSAAALAAQFSHLPNLSLTDCTSLPGDLWEAAGQDTLEGVYFASLQQAMEGADEQTCRRIELAARISRQILLGQEVTLP